MCRPTSTTSQSDRSSILVLLSCCGWSKYSTWSGSGDEALWSSSVTFLDADNIRLLVLSTDRTYGGISAKRDRPTFRRIGPAVWTISRGVGDRDWERDCPQCVLDDASLLSNPISCSPPLFRDQVDELRSKTVAQSWEWTSRQTYSIAGVKWKLWRCYGWWVVDEGSTTMSDLMTFKKQC